MSSAAPLPPLTINPEMTPNPNCTRYAVNRTLLSGAGRDFPNPDSAVNSPLARELFLLPEVTGVYIGADFVTVTTKTSNNWALPPLVRQCLQFHVSSGQPAVIDAASPATNGDAPIKMSEAAAGIIRILETEIRPAVAMDGGDIIFNSYDKGVLKLQLRGACHSCPSSLVTLKNGIEARLKKDFPDLIAVEAV
jgi:Fe-S cluster biogenesis protein NfuA